MELPTNVPENRLSNQNAKESKYELVLTTHLRSTQQRYNVCLSGIHILLPLGCIRNELLKFNMNKAKSANDDDAKGIVERIVAAIW